MRGSGVLAHITSLPSPYGIGDIGYPSYWFCDLLHSMKQTYWQILPINPVEKFYEFSPYSSYSAFAGNILLISPELLFEWELIPKEELEPCVSFSKEKTDYENSFVYKRRLLEISFENFLKNKGKREFEEFCEREKFWLEDYSNFVVLKKIFRNKEWNKWSQELIGRKESALEEFRRKNKLEIEKIKFFQFVFFTQWKLLRNYCKSKGVKIIGDIPIYVNFDSVEVWINRDIFKLRGNIEPEFVSGVPPDNFSPYGQLWGHPVYDWENLLKRDFDWWILRLCHSSRLFDIIRIDHFRGFESYWEVPFGEKTAEKGKWVKAPGEIFLKKVFEKIPQISLIAEDLGGYTDEVQRLLRIFNIPGTRVLQFGFTDGGSDNPYLPHNFDRNCVVYTGTHDNNTAKGWFEKELDGKGREKLMDYIGKEITLENVNWELIRLAMQSVAEIAIIPLQDILGLSEEGRMNKPATTYGNWRWRFEKDQVKEEFKIKFSDLTEIYGRGRK
jgi:4-alpha-glucanotransferase